MAPGFCPHVWKLHELCTSAFFVLSLPVWSWDKTNLVEADWCWMICSTQKSDTSGGPPASPLHKSKTLRGPSPRMPSRHCISHWWLCRGLRGGAGMTTEVSMQKKKASKVHKDDPKFGVVALWHIIPVTGNRVTGHSHSHSHVDNVWYRRLLMRYHICTHGKTCQLQITPLALPGITGTNRDRFFGNPTMEHRVSRRQAYISWLSQSFSRTWHIIQMISIWLAEVPTTVTLGLWPCSPELCLCDCSTQDHDQLLYRKPNMCHMLCLRSMAYLLSFYCDFPAYFLQSNWLIWLPSTVSIK